jgi:aminoglycoside phosphotransferase (APT) family kinase protein
MELRDRIARHLLASAGIEEVRAVRPLAGGACQDLFRVELVREGRAEAWVLRSDARVALPGSISRAAEFDVIGAAVAAGVPTPEARWFGEGVVREGAGAYLLAWREGVALGGKVVADPSLAAARQRLPEQLAAALAAVHRVPIDALGHLPGAAPGISPAAARLAHLRRTLDALHEARPDLERAYAWLVDHAPRDEAVGLCHGDFRVGNFLVGPDGLIAVLDWEFAHLGSPAEDLAWLCVRDWRFGRVREPVGGLCGRGRFLRAYAAAGGPAIDPAALHFWEVFGNVTWAAGALWQTRRFLEGEADLELLAIGRRAGEMAWEALRLIRRGPPVEGA